MQQKDLASNGFFATRAPAVMSPSRSETIVRIPYRPRPGQLSVHLCRKRFKVLVCHRRFGKTVCAINELLRQALANPLRAPRYAYIAPYYKQAKSVAWDYFKHFAGVLPGVRFHETELRCDLPNGGRISLLGADNPDSLRGIYPGRGRPG